jgi:hypothetical protein
VDTRPVLGVSALRPTFLDDVPATQPRQSQTRDGDGLVTSSDRFDHKIEIQDDVDDEEDEDDDINEDDDDGGDDDDDDDEDDEDIETWQVSDSGASR